MVVQEYVSDSSVSDLLSTSSLALTIAVAMVEMAYVMIRLFSEYDRIIDYGNDDVQLGITITLAPHPGVKVGFAKDSSEKM